MNNGLAIVVGLLAEGGPRDTGPDFGKASPVGLVIVVLLLIGTFLLVWSMNRHLRKLPKSFDGSEPDHSGDQGTVAGEPDKAPDNGGSPRDSG